MTLAQMVFGLFIGIAVLIFIIALITVVLYKFIPAYTRKIAGKTERIYKHPLGNSDIQIQDAMDNLKRVNSFVQKKVGEKENE